MFCTERTYHGQVLRSLNQPARRNKRKGQAAFTLRTGEVCSVSCSLHSSLLSSSLVWSAVPKAPPLHFSHDGRFKILQVADLHFSVARGKCRDTDLVPCSNSDNLTSTLIDHVLDAEKPDLVVFTGDQLNGQGTSWDSRSVLAKFAKAVIARKIPWVRYAMIILGSAVAHTPPRLQYLAITTMRRVVQKNTRSSRCKRCPTVSLNLAPKMFMAWATTC